MVTKQIPWQEGGGYISLTYGGSGSGTITVTSTPNETPNARQMQLAVKTVKGGTITRTVTITQAACPYNLKTADGYFIQTADGYIVNVKD